MVDSHGLKAFGENQAFRASLESNFSSLAVLRKSIHLQSSRLSIVLSTANPWGSEPSLSDATPSRAVLTPNSNSYGSCEAIACRALLVAHPFFAAKLRFLNRRAFARAPLVRLGVAFFFVARFRLELLKNLILRIGYVGVNDGARTRDNRSHSPVLYH